MGRFYNYFFGDKDSGTPEAGGWIPGASNPAPERPRIRFVLTGTTGTGKTSTVLQLFGHNNDLEGLGAKTSDRASETRETVEYVLKVKSKKSKKGSPQEVSLTVVDTPGLGDTDGDEQDARNLACVKRYMEDNPAEPNLVILTLKADDSRYDGEHSGFSRCIDYYLKGQLGLTRDGSNVVVVLTHALNITHHKRQFEEKSKNKMSAVQDMVYKKTGWKLPVVVLENEPPPETKRGDWTMLPDRTLQPKNLFEAIKLVFQRRQDLPGKLLTELYFSRSPSDSQVSVERGHYRAATLKSQKGPMTMDELAFYDLLTDKARGGAGSLPPFSRQDTEYRVKEYLKDSASYKSTSQPVEDENDTQSITSFTHSMKESLEDSLDSVSSASPTKQDRSNSMHLVGRCYDLTGGGSIKGTQVFKEETLSSGAIITREHSQTVTGSLDNSNKNCIFKRRGGSGMLAGMWQGVSGSAGGKDANDASDELEHRAVKVLVTMVTASDKLKEVWDLRQQLSQAYAKDLDKIPPHYTSKLRAKFEKFFNRWGQGFVITGYYGGEVRIRIKTDTEESFDGSGLSGAADSRGAVGGRSVPYHATMSGGASSLESAATRNTNQQADFCGGDPELHQWENIKAWKTSVFSRRFPTTELVVDVSKDVMLHHDFIRTMDSWLKLAGKRADALEEAFTDLYVPTRKEVVEAEAPRNASMFKRIVTLGYAK